MIHKMRISLFFLFITSISLAQTSIPPGNVSGTWQLSGSPYLINGDISIISGNTLTVEPGVIIRFQGNYKLSVSGRLLALGTLNDPIIFTAQDTSVGWHGIRFSNTNSNGMDSSKLIYCRLTSGKAVGSTSADKRGGAVYAESSSKILFRRCEFSNNYAINDGAAICLLSGSSPNIENCTFRYNQCGFFGAAFYIDASNPVIKNCVMSDGYSSVFGAGICIWNGSAPRIENCKIINNTAGAVCGIYATANSSPVIVGCLFSGNVSNLGNGGAMGFSVANPTIINCTLVNNVVAQGGAGIWFYNSTAVIRNSIIWNNVPDAVSATGSNVTIEYSDVTGITTGTGNFSLDPLFAGTGTDPFSIQENSPCKNTGTPDTAGLGLPLLDLAGQPRISDNRIDVGAYEYYVPVPVELHSFVSSVSGNSVILEWSTATETNNKGFEIERSKDTETQTWEKICFIKGKGTTAEKQFYSYTDKNLAAGKYTYRLKQIDFDGSFKYSEIIESEINVPDEFLLSRNYPNPFNPSTNIRYSIPVQSNVIIKVFDALGEEIETLVSEEQPAGSYEIKWNAANLSNGVYFYQITAGEFIQSKKMILMK